MPAEATVKHLLAAEAQKRNDVLEIGGGARNCAKSRRIQHATRSGEESKAEDAATDLEAARANVPVGQSIADEVKDGSPRTAMTLDPLAAPAAAPVATWSETIMPGLS